MGVVKDLRNDRLEIQDVDPMVAVHIACKHVSSVTERNRRYRNRTCTGQRYQANKTHKQTPFTCI